MASLERFSRENADKNLWKWTTEDGMVDPALYPPKVRLGDETGAWDYYAGASGTVNVADGERIVGIAVHASTAGTMTIGGGDECPIPAGVGLQVNPKGQLFGPVDIVFVGTDMFFVEVLT